MIPGRDGDSTTAVVRPGIQALVRLPWHFLERKQAFAAVGLTIQDAIARRRGSHETGSHETGSHETGSHETGSHERSQGTVAGQP
jgi:hypothetical protein